MDTPSVNGSNSLDEIDLFTPIMADLDTPTKKCFFILDKKVRNLEKKKSKLESYQQKLKEGETLSSEQKEALTKYDATQMNLEFARDIQNQLQMIFDQMESFEKEKDRIEKMNKMQSDLNRIREVLRIKMIVNLVHNFRHIFQHGVVNPQILSEEEFTAMEKFHMRICLPSTSNNGRLDSQIDQASTHMLYLLNRNSTSFDGQVTYASLRDSIDRLDRLGLVDKAAQKFGANFAKIASDKNGVKKLEGGSQVAVATISATLCASTLQPATSVLDTSTVSVVTASSVTVTKSPGAVETVTKSASCTTVTGLEDKSEKEVTILDNLDFFPPIAEKCRPVAVISSSIDAQDGLGNIEPIAQPNNNNQVVDPQCQLETRVAVVPHCDVLRHAPVQQAFGYMMNPAVMATLR